MQLLIPSTFSQVMNKLDFLTENEQSGNIICQRLSLSSVRIKIEALYSELSLFSQQVGITLRLKVLSGSNTFICRRECTETFIIMMDHDNFISSIIIIKSSRQRDDNYEV